MKNGMQLNIDLYVDTTIEEPERKYFGRIAGLYPYMYLGKQTYVHTHTCT